MLTNCVLWATEAALNLTTFYHKGENATMRWIYI